MQLPAIYRLMACCCACCPHRVQVSYCLPGKLCSCHRFQESSNQPFNQFSQIWVLISVKHSCLPTIFSIIFLKKIFAWEIFFSGITGMYSWDTLKGWREGGVTKINPFNWKKRKAETLSEMHRLKNEWSAPVLFQRVLTLRRRNAWFSLLNPILFF